MSYRTTCTSCGDVRYYDNKFDIFDTSRCGVCNQHRFGLLVTDEIPVEDVYQPIPQLDLKHKLTHKLINQLGGALLAHGNEVFDNLGPAELLDIDAIVTKLRKHKAYDVAVALMQLSQTCDNAHRCEKFAAALTHRMRDWTEMTDLPDIKSLLYPF